MKKLKFPKKKISSKKTLALEGLKSVTGHEIPVSGAIEVAWGGADCTWAGLDGGVGVEEDKSTSVG